MSPEPRLVPPDVADHEEPVPTFNRGEREVHEELLRANEEAEAALLKVVRDLAAARERYKERQYGR